jgi:cell division protein FtsL
MKRIRKPTDKEIHSAEQHQRKKVNHNSKKEKASLLTAQNAVLLEPVKIVSIDWQAPSVTLSLRDRASQLLLSDDQMTCKGVEVSDYIMYDNSATVVIIMWYAFINLM